MKSLGIFYFKYFIVVELLNRYIYIFLFLFRAEVLVVVKDKLKVRHGILSNNIDGDSSSHTFYYTCVNTADNVQIIRDK